MNNSPLMEKDDKLPPLSPVNHDDGTDSSVSESSTEETERKEVVGAAAVTGAAAGMALGGPPAAVLTGAGMAYLASSNDGCLGGTTRATGKAVLGLKDRAARWEDEHHYVGNAAQSARKRVEEWERNHHYVEKTKELTKSRWEKLQGFIDEKRVLERIQGFTEGTYRAVVPMIERSTTAITKGTTFAIFKIKQCVHPDVSSPAAITDPVPNKRVDTTS
jgi:hypothetical protein